MHRFLLKQNIQRYRRLLEGETERRPRVMLESMLTVWQRQLAELDAETRGAPQGPARPGRSGFGLRQFQRQFEALRSPSVLLDPGPGLPIVDLNEAYAEAAMVDRRVAGERLFKVFPDNPRDPAADGVARVYASLRTAAATGRPHAMAKQRYDVRDADGFFVERWWRPVTTPIFADDDRLAYLLMEVEDITGEVLRRRA